MRLPALISVRRIRRCRGQSNQHISLVPVVPSVRGEKNLEQLLSVRFEKQAARRPGHLAFTTGKETITYEDLDGAANGVARAILSMRGPGEEPVIALSETSVSLVISLLGIFKAGKIYVPLNSSNPRQRIDYILKDTGARLIVTDTTHLDLACEFGDKKVALLNVDDLDPHCPLDRPAISIQPDNLATVLYTSGSTGEPKGVMHTHRSLLHTNRRYIDTLQLQPDDRILSAASFAFAGGLKSLLGSLLNGTTMVALKPERIDQMAEMLVREKITVCHISPSILRNLLRTLNGHETFPRLRLFYVAGDTLYKTDVELFRKLLPTDKTLIHVLALTEAGPVREYVVDDTEQIEGDVVPVGYAVADMEILLLDEKRNPVGPAEVGEIAIRSRYLSSGYWRKPELTRVSFLPATEGGGGRMYLTGDLGRMMPDAGVDGNDCLLYLGRKDFQMKIRGYQVNAAEVESALTSVPGVKETVVAARNDRTGDQRLVAYLVSTGEHPVSITVLRRRLADKLPEYMIPSAFVFLDAFPLTPHGKVDRDALPEPKASRPELEIPYSPPQSSKEKRVADIWIEVLGLAPIGVQDNFFELGGHSLLAAKLLVRIEKDFGVHLSLGTLFQAATVSGMVEEIEGADNRQDRSLKLPDVIPAPNQRYRSFPLTDIQQAYWAGRSGAFELGNVSTHFYLEVESVDLDLNRLSAAWQMVIERHDMLRAIILPDGRQQVLQKVPAYEFEVLDLRGGNPEVRESKLGDLRQQMSHQVLPGDRWPLFDIRASRLDERRYRMHLSFDALILDARSRFLLMKEWSQLYQNPDQTLDPLTLSFRDYVLTEATLKDSELYRRSREYWWDRLDTLPPAPELPLNKNPCSVRCPRFRHRRARLEPETWLGLKNRAARAGLTPSVVLLSAFAEVLKVWSKNPRLTINLPVFHRLPLHPQVNDIVGDFTSLTLLEVNNSAELTFESRAQHLQQQLWDDMEHRYVSGVEVLRELARRRGGEPKAIMPVVFTSLLHHEIQVRDPRVMRWLGDVVYSNAQTPQVWLDTIAGEEMEALVFRWNAVEELFPPGLLNDMFEAYCLLLQDLANLEEPWQEPGSETALRLIPPAQVAHRASVNATDRTVPAKMLHTLFAEQVPRGADWPAVITPQETITYEELYRRANQVGHRLRRLGVRPNTLVGVVMEKGWEQVAAVLGVLTSGAAFLPVEAHLPKERCRHLLEHGGVECVLTQSRVDENIRWPEGIRRLCVDGKTLVNETAEPLAPVQEPEDLAYVIYTSGSTGLPKGVMIDHRAAVNTILDINQRFGVGPQDRILALSSLSFDLSIYDIFGTLAAGGTVIIPEASEMRNPAHWAEMINREKVTIWNSVPALMELMVEYLRVRPEALLPSLRLVLLSGDWIPVSLPGKIRAIDEEMQVIGLGGATEASIWSILYPIEDVDPAWKSIPYGRPMVNQRFHVLNEALTPCPNWVPGQLYIGGFGLARGYWRNEERTRAGFIIHPRTGERLYRTGDTGRYLPDGNIEFLGREDLQVKIQGYRIELGEIETALGQHPAVRTAIVKAVGERHENKRLVAYVVPEQNKVPTSVQLTNFLKQKLPEYMVPHAFIPLKNLPLTPGGKVDRGGLPDPSRRGFEPSRQPESGPPDLVRRLGQLVASILKIDSIDPSANLLNLGATSLDMIRIANLLESELNFRPNMNEFYQLPTITALAYSCHQERLQGRKRPAPEPGQHRYRSVCSFQNTEQDQEVE